MKKSNNPSCVIQIFEFSKFQNIGLSIFVDPHPKISYNTREFSR